MTQMAERRNGFGRRTTDNGCAVHPLLCEQIHDLQQDLKSKAPWIIVIPTILAALGFVGWISLFAHGIDKQIAVVTAQQEIAAKRQEILISHQEEILRALGIYPTKQQSLTPEREERY